MLGTRLRDIRAFLNPTIAACLAELSWHLSIFELFGQNSLAWNFYGFLYPWDHLATGSSEMCILETRCVFYLFFLCYSLLINVSLILRLPHRPLLFWAGCAWWGRHAYMVRLLAIIITFMVPSGISIQFLFYLIVFGRSMKRAAWDYQIYRVIRQLVNLR